MEPSQQSLPAEAHLKVLNSRFKSLEYELDGFVNEGKSLEKEIEQFKSKRDQIKLDLLMRKEEIKLEFNGELEEYQKQTKLAEEMLEKKKEERKALMEYLNSSGIYLKSCEELQNFGWHTLNKMAEANKNMEAIECQKRKAAEFAGLSRIARDGMSKIAQLLNSARLSQIQADKKKEELKDNVDLWMAQNERQTKQIAKMQHDHERLNLLIKQCGSSNEPMTEYITKNVRAECHSFLNSECPRDMLNGLLKFRARQERIIKLLKHKETKLARETNLLQVATDQTTDLTQYYDNMK